jgi:hypothetical protein
MMLKNVLSAVYGWKFNQNLRIKIYHKKFSVEMMLCKIDPLEASNKLESDVGMHRPRDRCCEVVKAFYAQNDEKIIGLTQNCMHKNHRIAHQFKLLPTFSLTS